MTDIKPNKQGFVFAAAFLLTVAVNIFSWNKPFFWDTLLTSSITRYYYENGFGNLILPSYLDAGHPPFFYIYVVFFYKIFGLNLWAAHLSMLPPSLLGIFAYVKIMEFYNFNQKMQFIAIFAFFCVPPILTQHILVSYDLALMSLFLFGVYCILYKKNITLAIIAITISAISTRGILINFSIFIILIIFYNNIKRAVFTMFPSVLFFFGWMFFKYHFSQSVFDAGNDWSEHRGWANGKELVGNLISLGRSLFDFGIFILFGIQVYQFFTVKKISILQLFWLVPFLVFAFSFVLLSNPIGHRYFMIIYVFMLLASIDFLYKKKKTWMLILTLLPLGHFQIYGYRISNGWDCTLAHLSFFTVKKEFDQFISDHKIKKQDIGTVMPLQSSDAQYYISGNNEKMPNVHQKNIEDYKYILYSNVCNDFSDEQLDEMAKLPIIKEEKAGQIRMVLYGGNSP
jgi:hypothetical protein